MRLYLIRTISKIGHRNVIDIFKIQASTATVAHCIAMKQVENEYSGYKLGRILVLNCRLVA